MTTPHQTNESDYAQLRVKVASIEVAMCEAAQEAVQLHQRLGLPLVEWHNGQIVLVPPDQISVDSRPPL